MAKEGSNFPNNTGSPFNMAIDTLQRLGDILREITEVSTRVLEDPILSQSMKVSLVKQFFLNAIPLLVGDAIKNFRDKIIKLEVQSKKTFQNKGWMQSPSGENQPYFSTALDKLLDNYLIELQIELQKNKIFMPSKSDPKYSWNQN